MTTTPAPPRLTRPAASPVPVATIVVAGLAALLQVVGALADVAGPLVLATAPPEGFQRYVIASDDLVVLLRGLGVRALAVAACTAAIAFAVRGRDRPPTRPLRGALAVAVVVLLVSAAPVQIDLGGLTSWTW